MSQRLYLRRPGSRRAGRPPLSDKKKAQRETLRRPRREAPAPSTSTALTLKTISEINEWTVEPACKTRNPPGVLTSSEIAALLGGLDPVAKLVALRLLSVFWDWPPASRPELRAFARAAARLMLAEPNATTTAARRRVRTARARVMVLADRLQLQASDVREALAPLV